MVFERTTPKWCLPHEPVSIYSAATPFFQRVLLAVHNLWRPAGIPCSGLKTGRVRGLTKQLRPSNCITASIRARSLVARVAAIPSPSSEGVCGWNDTAILNVEHLLASAGFGARAVLDEITVLRFDLGFSPEYVRDETGARIWRNRMGSYVIVGHSF